MAINKTVDIILLDEIAVAVLKHHGDPQQTVSQSIHENPFGIINKTIRAGRCAVSRHQGADNTQDGLHYLGGEHHRDFPIYLQRIIFIS